MDYGMLRQSVRRIMTLVPIDFVATLASAIMAHKDVIRKNFGEIVEELKPHIKAGMLEGGTGMFDMEELETEIKKFLAEDMGISPEVLAQLHDSDEGKGE